jgi:hypothetical protein
MNYLLVVQVFIRTPNGQIWVGINTVLPARLANLGAQFDLLEYADYLGFAESGFLRVETPFTWIL